MVKYLHEDCLSNTVLLKRLKRTPDSEFQESYVPRYKPELELKVQNHLLPYLPLPPSATTPPQNAHYLDGPESAHIVPYRLPMIPTFRGLQPRLGERALI